jgi:tetratricopeptide (TPR) repeat protein
MEEQTMKNMIVIALGVVLVYGASPAFCQSGEPDIQKRLELIEKGQSEQVKGELQALLTNYQNNPGVMYLQGVLTTDGTEAVKIYQSIVDNFPKSEWADDALYKLYQYYYSIGLYKTADQKIAQLKQDYPFSAYAVEQTTMPKEEAVEMPAVVKPKGTIQKFSTSFTIQVGAFSTLSRAEELKNFFEGNGYSSNIFTMVSNGKKLHKVWVGEFQNQEEAKRFALEIKRKFSLESIVVAR